MTGRWPNTSLRAKLSLSVAMLLAILVLGFGISSYTEVRNALTTVAETRVEVASDRIEDLLRQVHTQETTAVRSLAERPVVREYARAAPADAASDVRGALDSFVEGNASRIATALVAPGASPLIAGDSAAVGEWIASVSQGLGRFRSLDGDRLAYTFATPLVVEGDTVGRLVDVRTLGANPQSGETIRGLIGRDADFFVGHRSGDLWTDLRGPVPAPPESTPTTGPLQRAPADTVSGRPAMVGRVSAVQGTPWLLWVALPASTISGPLNAFTARIGLVTLLLIGVGGAGTWYIGRRITNPLVRLTSAAERIARGDYSGRVETRRADEIGRLGDAFDTMAARVQEAHEELEAQVADRTADLEATLEELREAQDELVRKERLAILGELAGGVGHELRNPLGVMTNAVFYLDAVLADREEVVDEYLDLLRQQIHVSEKIVTDLLDFARVKPPKRRSVAVSALVEEQIERAAPDEEIDVRREFPDDLPDASVDPDQIGQVVLNLVTNASQAMERSGGTLTVRARAEDGRVHLDVEDEGPGIPEDEMDRIFEPLFTTKPKGIGLGLSVSRSLAEANGGSLRAENADGSGARFTLTLPRAGSGATPSGPAAASRSGEPADG